MKPHRVQIRRIKGWRMPPNTVSVARPSRYGNPHRIGFCPVCGVDHTREEALAEFKAQLAQYSEWDYERFDVLRGKNLACYCALDQACHADILLEIANR